MSPWYVLTAKAASSLLGCLSMGMDHELREGIVALHVILVRPHLNTASSLEPQHRKDVEKKKKKPPGRILWWWGWCTCPWGKTWGAGLVQSAEETDLGISNRTPQPMKVIEVAPRGSAILALGRSQAFESSHEQTDLQPQNWSCCE